METDIRPPSPIIRMNTDPLTDKRGAVDAPAAVPSPIIRISTDTLAVQRGRDKCAVLREAVMELRARGADPTRILVSAATAADMHSFVAWFAKSYDGVLPPILGVPVVEAMLGGQDATFECAVGPLSEVTVAGAPRMPGT